jgi:hypothetical protein
MSGTNALMLPTQNPATRFAEPPIGLQGPQEPASALPAAPSPPAGAQAPPGPAPSPIAPGVQAVDPAQTIREHADAVRGTHPHIHAEAAKAAAEDAFHAVKHGFIADHAAARKLLLDHPVLLLRGGKR